MLTNTSDASPNLHADREGGATHLELLLPRAEPASEATVHRLLEIALCFLAGRTGVRATILSDRQQVPTREAETAITQLWCWARRHDARLVDGRVLSCARLSSWLLQLQDQLRFELGDERYAAARIDDAAKQLWHWLESESSPLPVRAAGDPSSRRPT